MLDELLLGRSAKSSLALYVDAFDPPETIPPETLRVVGTKVIPPLLSALAGRGLQVFVTHDLSYLETIRAQSNGGMEIVKLNDRKFQPKANRDDTSLLILARGAQLVGSIGSRLLWCEGSLAEELESGRFWVSDPATMWAPKDRCIVTSGTAKVIGSCPIVYCGSVYLDPSIRGGFTLAAMCRLHVLWLICHWRWSWLAGFVEDTLLSRHAFDVYGTDTIEQGIWLTRDDSELHHYYVCLTRRQSAMESWLRPEMGDLSRPMGRPSRAVLPVEALQQSRDGSRRAHA